MSDRILIDTSVWIEFFRNTSDPSVNALAQLLLNDRVATTDLIEAELLRGALTTKELSFLENYFSQIIRLPPLPDFWRKVGRFSFQLARKGCLPAIIDAAIALSAMHHETFLLTLDKDFQRIAARSSLRLFDVSS